MKILYTIIFLVLASNSFSQSIIGEYQDTCCVGDFFFQLKLKKGNEFEYKMGYKHGTAQTSGKWKFTNDTLFLFDYDYIKEIDTIIFVEDASVQKDSIRIEIIGDRDIYGKMQNFKFILNEDCNDIVETIDGLAKIKKRAINSLRIDNQTYLITGNKFNCLKIKANSFRFIITPVVHNIRKWLYKNNNLYQINCEASMNRNPWVKQ